MPAAQEKAMTDYTSTRRSQRLREVRKKEGLVRVEVYARPEHVDRIKALARELLEAGRDSDDPPARSHQPPD